MQLAGGIRPSVRGRLTVPRRELRLKSRLTAGKFKQYNRGRDLITYVSRQGGLGYPLTDRLMEAGPQTHIADFGSGKTIAMGQIRGSLSLDFARHYVKTHGAKVDGAEALLRYADMTAEERPRVSAFTVELSRRQARRLREDSGMNLRYGRFFEELSVEEVMGQHGPVDVGGDLWGIMAYTRFPDVSLRKIFQVLDDKGIYIMRIGSENYESRGANGLPVYDSSYFHSSVRTRSGVTLRFPDWIATIPGIHAEIKAPLMTLEIKDRSRIEVPELRFVKKLITGTVPEAKIFEEL